MRLIFKMLLALILCSTFGCATNNSGSFDKSPCVCNFEPVNTGDYKQEGV